MLKAWLHAHGKENISAGLCDAEQSHAFWEHGTSLHPCSSQQHLLAGSVVMALPVQGAGLSRKEVLTSNGSMYFCIIANKINDLLNCSLLKISLLDPLNPWQS